MSEATLSRTWREGIPVLIGGVLLLGVAIAAVLFFGAASLALAFAAAAVLVRGFDRILPFPAALVLGTGVAAGGFMLGLKLLFG